jgi:hypothetical protein
VWIVRALAQLAARVVIGVVVALALAGLLALAREEPFADAFVIACWIVAALAILLGAAGQTAWSHNVETSGRIPGVPAYLRTRPGDTSLSTGAVFVLTGALLIVLAVVLG